MRVVLDTNIYVSGVRYGGKPMVLLQRMGPGNCTLIVSEEILAELEDVLLRKFSWKRETVESTIDRIRAIAEVANPEFELAECIDPDDNRILEAAVAGAADCIVTGDKHLLRMKVFRGIMIMTVNDFLLSVGR
jgi:putative PIN family toxin of toxin-antitoxin system